MRGKVLVMALMAVGLVGMAGADELKRRGFLGVLAAPLDDQTRQAAGLPPEAQGVVVAKLAPGGSAEAAGLRKGDVITKVGDQAIGKDQPFPAPAARLRGGDEVVLSVVRAKAPMIVKVQVREFPRATSPNFDVIYGSATIQGGARVRTIVTKPRSGQAPRFPALFVIQGLAMASIDLPPSAPDPYRALIAVLGQEFVTLRVDKPGVGDSEGGPPSAVTFEAELDAYRQALKSLQGLDFVDPDRIYLFGHSLGGIMAPILASEVPVKGVAVYGTVYQPWASYELANARRRLKLSGLAEDEVESRVREFEDFAKQLYAEKKTIRQIAEGDGIGKAVVAMRTNNPDLLLGRTPKFYHQLGDQDNAAAWSKVKAQVLAIWGDADYVALKEDAEALAKAMNAAHPGQATYLELKGIDHGLEKADSPEESMQRGPGGGGEFNPAIATALKEWIAGAK